MKRWWKKLRGFLGLTSVGAVAGAVFGAAGTAVASLVGTGALHLQAILLGAGAWGGIAGVATAGVAAFLAAGGPRESLSELSPARAGLVGAAIGAGAPFLLVAGIKLLILGIAPTLTVTVGSSMLIGGALGGALGSGLVRVAQKSEARRIQGGDAPLLHGGE